MPANARCTARAELNSLKHRRTRVRSRRSDRDRGLVPGLRGTKDVVLSRRREQEGSARRLRRVRSATTSSKGHRLKLLLQSILDGVDGAETDPHWRRRVSHSQLARERLSAIHFLLSCRPTRALLRTRIYSRRSGKHLPAREKNWSSAVPYPFPSPAHVRSIPKQRSQRVRHYGSSSARSPDTADPAAPHRPRRADAIPLLGGVIV